MICKRIILALMIIIQITLTLTINVIADEANSEVINFIEDKTTSGAIVEPGKLRPFIIRGFIDGTVFDHNNVTRATFQLNASINLNWSMIVEPWIIDINRMEKKNFSITIYVPENCSYYISGTFSLSFIITEYPGNLTYKTAPLTGTIQVAQFYRLDTNISDQKRTLLPGEKRSISIDIMNYGNARDTVGLKIINYQSLLKKGIDIELPSSMETKERTLGRFDLKIDTSNDVKPGKYTIECLVFSEQKEILEDKMEAINVNLTLVVERDYTVSMIITGSVLILVVVAIVIIRYRKRSGV